MSDFHVEVVRLKNVAKHPNADSLAIGEAAGAPVIFRLGDYGEGDLAAYVPVDAIVPDAPQWAFLKGHNRIKAARLRGVFSMGVLAKPADFAGGDLWVEGQDVREALAIEKYDRDAHAARAPGASMVAGVSEPPPPFAFPEYTDIEPFRRWKDVLISGEEIVCHEKVHGACSRFVYRDGRLWVGSRHQIKKPPGDGPTVQYKVMHLVADERRVAPGGFHDSLEIAKEHAQRISREIDESVAAAGADLRSDITIERVEREAKVSAWWQVAADLGLESRLAAVPGTAIYGEVYGQVQDLKYGKAGIELVLFDALDTNTGRYLDHDAFLTLAALLGLPVVPQLYRGLWPAEGPERDALLALAEGKTTVGGDHVREGFVVKPTVDRRDETRGGLGRVVLKVVGSGYLLRKGA